MARRKSEEHNIRRLMKLGETSYAITIPIEMDDTLTMGIDLKPI